MQSESSWNQRLVPACDFQCANQSLSKQNNTSSLCLYFVKMIIWLIGGLTCLFLIIFEFSPLRSWVSVIYNSNWYLSLHVFSFYQDRILHILELYFCIVCMISRCVTINYHIPFPNFLFLLSEKSFKGAFVAYNTSFGIRIFSIWSRSTEKDRLLIGGWLINWISCLHTCATKWI